VLGTSLKTIQIRNVPDDVHRALRMRAAAAGVSLSELALDELTIAATRPPIAEVLRRADARAGGPTTEAVVAAVRSMREGA
jgi:plasmid stability protein